MDNYMKIFRNDFEEKLLEFNSIINASNKVSKLIKYLMDTQRNPYDIIKNGYNKTNLDSMLHLATTINHAVLDDGEITFYIINKKPRIAFVDHYDYNWELVINEELAPFLNLFSEHKLLEFKKGIKLEFINLEEFIIKSEKYFQYITKQHYEHDCKRDKPDADQHYKQYSFLNIK